MPAPLLSHSPRVVKGSAELRTFDMLFRARWFVSGTSRARTRALHSARNELKIKELVLCFGLGGGLRPMGRGARGFLRFRASARRPRFRSPTQRVNTQHHTAIHVIRFQAVPLTHVVRTHAVGIRNPEQRVAAAHVRTHAPPRGL